MTVMEATGDEAGLVASAARGETAAFEEIVRRHAGLVMGLGVRLMGNRAEAEDLLQDVFLRVHRALPGFRGEASLKGWITQVTVNAARNRHRSARRRFRHVTSSLDERRPGDAADAPPRHDVADERAGPERRVLGSEAQARIDQALAALSPDFREAIVLREIEGLSYDEIALAVGVSVGTVKSRISRARERLQDMLRDLVDDPTVAG